MLAKYSSARQRTFLAAMAIAAALDNGAPSAALAAVEANTHEPVVRGPTTVVHAETRIFGASRAGGGVSARQLSDAIRPFKFVASDAAPRSWTDRACPNLISSNQARKGGHFAAWEQPQIFTEELRAAFRSVR